MKNYELAYGFVKGATTGQGSHMYIHGSTLYSYSKVIAIRLKNRIILSNKATFLGGYPYSITTTNHLHCIATACEDCNVTARVVTGWANEGDDEQHIPQIPNYATMKGLWRAFILRRWANDLWMGAWNKETNEKKVEWLIENDELIAPNDCMVAFRTFVRQPCIAGDCDSCIARFICLSIKDGFRGHIITVVEGTGYEDELMDCLGRQIDKENRFRTNCLITKKRI